HLSLVICHWVWGDCYSARLHPHSRLTTCLTHELGLVLVICHLSLGMGGLLFCSSASPFSTYHLLKS
ncbi:hypothetical protein, partial [Nostoc sp. CHAB 5715]|uniref:hypothetical protein n=1 Tax=Nostoc sp. CHAB 5715 TaxID=2780400 RepID=UPI001E4E9A93